MADVIIGRAGTAVLVDLDVCVKTGRTTTQRVTLRGHTTPPWVMFVLLFSIIGFLIAGTMASRRYRVTVPFMPDLHARWRANRNLAWVAGIAGSVAIVAASTIGSQYAGVLVGVAVALIGGSAVLGTSNSTINNVGVRMSRDHDLVLTRVHPAFVAAVRTASVEPAGSR